MGEKQQQAVAKFRYLERRAMDLWDRLARFEEEKGSEFALWIPESGDRGVWEWTGGDLGLPEDMCLELGEIMAGLRSCLDVALYEVSEEARTLGHVKRNQISFPCLRRSEDWTDGTLSWLADEKRECVLRAQRFSGPNRRDIDCAVIGALAAQDKHRGLLELTMGGGSKGFVGAVSRAWARELGLGRQGPDGYFNMGTTYGTPTKILGRDNVVVEGPLGGLALIGTIPWVSIGYASNLEMDHEEDKQRLGRVSVFDSMDQALSEVAEILSSLGGAEVPLSVGGAVRRSDPTAEMPATLAAEATSIYGHVPRVASDRPGWWIHLREVREDLHRRSAHRGSRRTGR